MTVFGTTKLTISELPDELRFHIDREFGWFQLAGLPLLGFALLIFSLRLPGFGLRITLASIAIFSLLVTAIGLVLARKQDRTTDLTVTSQTFVATGYGLGVAVEHSPGSILSSRAYKAVVPLSEVRWLEYAHGDEDSYDGLYANLGHWKRCILPGLNRKQCKQAITAIQQRFPQIGSKPARMS